MGAYPSGAIAHSRVSILSLVKIVARRVPSPRSIPTVIIALGMLRLCLVLAFLIIPRLRTLSRSRSRRSGEG